MLMCTVSCQAGVQHVALPTTFAHRIPVQAGFQKLTTLSVTRLRHIVHLLKYKPTVSKTEACVFQNSFPCKPFLHASWFALVT